MNFSKEADRVSQEYNHANGGGGTSPVTMTNWLMLGVGAFLVWKFVISK